MKAHSNFVMTPWRSLLVWSLCQLSILGFASLRAEAQSCQTSDELNDATRTAIKTVGQHYFDLAAKGDVTSLQQNSIPSLASDFSAVATRIKDHQQDLASAQATVKSVFLLDASGPAPLPHAEFLCGVFGKNGQTANSAAFYLDNLPPAKYAVALIDATSAKGKIMFSEILQLVGTDWKLGGLYLTPALVMGHDADWYIARAREYKTKGQLHNAWLFYLQARSLISPLPFMSTLATDKLYEESQAGQPADMPADGKTADLAVGGTTYKLTSVFAQNVGNDLDLVVKYKSANAADNNRAYQDNVAVMKAMLAKFPELREAFGGMVARAVDDSGHDYGTLMAMKDIK